MKIHHLLVWKCNMQQTQKQLDRLVGDQGCDLHPSCLECPLPRCRHDLEDEKIGQRGPHARTLRYAEQAANLRQRGFSIEQIGRRFGRSRREIYRFLAVAEQEGADVPRRKIGRPREVANGQ